MNADEQHPSRRQRLWRGSLRAWRWTRWTLWLVLALFTATLIYLNRVGLPDFLKERLQAELYERGLRLEFTRLFLHPARGIVAEELHLMAGDGRSGPEIHVPSADLGLNYAALLALDVKVDSLLLRDGRVRWSLPGTNQSPRVLEADRITAGIHFRGDDRWELHHLRARGLGFELSANGSLAHASRLGELKPQRTNELERVQFERQLQELLARFDQMKFPQPIALTLNFHADAHTDALEAELAGRVPHVESPWVSGRDGDLHLRLTRAGGTNAPLIVAAEMRLAGVQTKWGGAQAATVSAKAISVPAYPGLWQMEGDLSLMEPRTRWGEASETRARVKATASFESAQELSVEWAATITKARTRWGEADSLSLNGEVKPAADPQHLSLITFSGEGEKLKTEWGEARRGDIEFTQAGTEKGATGRTARIKLHDIKTPEMEAAEANLTALWKDIAQPHVLFTGQIGKPRAPFGSAGQMLFSFDLTNAAPWSANATATFNDVVTPRVRAPRLLLNAVAKPAKATNMAALKWSAEVKAVESEWARATNVMLRGEGDWHVREKRPAPQQVSGQIERIASRWGDTAKVDFTAHVTPPPSNFVHKAAASWGLWRPIEPFALEADVKLENLRAEKLEVEKILTKVRWRSPELTMETLDAALYGGTVAVTGRVDVASRQVAAYVRSDFDLHRLEPLLGTNMAKWLAPFTWEKPPRIQVQVQLKLPAWTNAVANWEQKLWSALDLNGTVAVGRAAYSGISVESISTDLLIRDDVLRLSEWVVTRPEGRTTLSYTEHFGTREHHGHARGLLDPTAVRPLLDGATRKVFDQFQFRTPLELDVEVRGRWNVPESTGLRARIATTNLIFKGEPFSNVAATVTFTNRLLTATDVRIARGPEQVAVGRVAVDWANDRITIDGARSTMDPLLVTGLIGADTRKAIEPYQFVRPPTARVNGSLPISNSERTDLTFELSGGPFQWGKFRLPDLNATVHWVTNQVVITNVTGAFYGGRIAGQARFDVGRAKGADFQFDLTTKDADLHELLKDVSSSTNKVKGRLNGRLAITEANTAEDGSWRGFGDATLRDGLLWDVPLIGVSLPLLNKILPNHDRNRAKEASAHFTITNSVIHTKDLEIRAAPVLLHYKGTVGFDQKVDMRVEAELFKETWVGKNVPPVGWLLGKVTRVFAFQVGGALDQPKIQLEFIANPLTLPLLPFKFLYDLFPERKPNP